MSNHNYWTSYFTYISIISHTYSKSIFHQDYIQASRKNVVRHAHANAWAYNKSDRLVCSNAGDRNF